MQPYGAMIAQLRALLDAISAADPDAATLAELTTAMADWTGRLGPPAPESEARFTLRRPLPSRGRAMVPPFVMERQTADAISGTVVFGAHFLGRNRSAHGGAVAMLFDEVAGALVNQPGMPRARAACLTIDYLQVTPIDRTLSVVARIVEQARRKRVIEATLSCDDRICARATGIFVVLAAGQP